MHGVRIGWNTNENGAVFLCPQVCNNLLPGSVSSQPDYYTSKVTAIVSATLTVTDIQGADLSEPLVLFWHYHWESNWNKLPTATLSWLSFIPNTLSDLALLSRLLRNQWKGEPSFWLGLLSQLVTCVQVYRVVLDRTSTNSHSSHTIVSVQLSCLSLKLGNWSSCDHVNISNHPPADFVIHCNTLRTRTYKKKQLDVTSYIPCILSLTCNLSIVAVIANVGIVKLIRKLTALP